MQTEEERVPVTYRPCKFLRCKEMYYRPGILQDENWTGHSFSCIKTHESFGPDGGVVDKQECCSGRGCYTR